MNTEKCFRVAIIGAGNIAQTMVDSIRPSRNISVVAIAARDLERAMNFARKNRIPQYYGSYDELIQSEGYDLIYIATVNSTHFEIASKCLSNCRNVLIEKPVCMNADQVAELVKLAHENNIFLSEAMPLRYSSNMKKVTDYVNSGAIGDIRLLESNIGIKCWGIERISEAALGGGALFDLGVYGLTLAEMLYRDHELKGVCSEATFEKGVDSDNTIVLTYKETRAICYNSVKHQTNCCARISGDKGVIYLIRAFNAELVLCYAGLRKLRVFRTKKGSNYLNEMIACSRAINSGLLEPACYSHDEMIKTSAMMDRVRDCWMKNME